jgi:hypothetical protein
MDLMLQQNFEGDQVALMWPGEMRTFQKKVEIKNRGLYIIDKNKIQNFEVINPLPVSYDEGISEFESFERDAGGEQYRNFLADYKPDVIHVHTLMGLHKSFLVAAKEQGITLVFTAHDFFPICPKVNMFRCGAICHSIKQCRDCGICNTTSLSIRKIQFLQSPIYRKLKDSKIVKKLRKQHRDKFLSERSVNQDVTPVGTAAQFKKLRGYYESMLQMMNMVHYNSSVTKKVYECFFDLPHSSVVGITHHNIVDKRAKKNFSDDMLRIRYLGPNGGAKGFFFLRRHWINYGVKERISA